MKVSSDLKKYIVHPALSGSDIISSSRAILHYMGDVLADEGGECIEPFASIDSQTDYIELDGSYPFALPSPRVSLSGSRMGALIGSDFRDPITPSHPDYTQELKSVFECFKGIYENSVEELLRK